MTVLQLKTKIASFHGKSLSDLTVNGEDLGLAALNQVRLTAELQHDFNFQRKLLTVSVNTATGGSLDTAVLYGTATLAKIKTIVDVGLFDQFGNFIPQEWTTVAEGLARQRATNPGTVVRYPTDGQVLSGPSGQRRFTVVNDKIYTWPRAETGETITVGIEAYIFSDDWEGTTTIAVTGATGDTDFNTTYYLVGAYNGKGLWVNVNPLTAANDGSVGRMLWWKETGFWVMSTGNDFNGLGTNNYASVSSSATTPGGLTFVGAGTVHGTIVAGAATSSISSTNDVWTLRGNQLLEWGAIIQLNYRFKTFVSRQEGNVAPPAELMQQGLQALLDWDVFTFEQFRRHGR